MTWYKSYWPTTVWAPKETTNEELRQSNNTHPVWWKDPGLRKLNAYCFLLLLGSLICGYDGVVLNAAFGIDSFLRDMDDPDSSKQGLLIGAISLGYLAGFLPASWAGDRFGRKWPQLCGTVVILAGCFVQTFAIGGWNFFGGRMLLGFGNAFPLTLGCTHLMELAHPRHASRLVVMFAAIYMLGCVMAAWISFGTTYLSSNWAWRIPVLCQGLGSAIQLVTLWMIPESPRWLCAQGRSDEAHAILATYHANGDMNDDLVQAEMVEITTAIEREQQAAAFGYLEFFRTKGNVYRLFMVIWLGLIQQWMGNGIISYYLIPVLDTIGVTSAVQQQGINGGLQIFNLVASIVGNIYVNRFSRRFVWLSASFGILLSYTMFTVASAVFNANGNQHAGRAAVAMIFIFSGFFDVSYSNFYYSYPLEMLPYRMRTKGMALNLMFDYGALFFNQYINPIGFNNLGYAYYYIFIAIIVIQIVIVWFVFPETAGLTLEQSGALLDLGVRAETLQQLETSANLAKAETKEEGQVYASVRPAGATA
ncbi:uncharacterized protein JCM10292_002066 [Rhodotorula paludigena]|uniref:uncharacterized protein n=1 Tax=Rhodotorula paludigena TaxID=86838 RepID=UPI0031760A6E